MSVSGVVRCKHVNRTFRRAVSLFVSELRKPAARHPWEEELSNLKVHLGTLSSDFEKTTFLREYVGTLIDIGRPDDEARSLYPADFDSVDLAQLYELFKQHTLPAECGLTSLFYIKLLHAFEFNAYQYSFGFTKKPYDNFIHSVALVDIGSTGRKRVIIQDPYCNLTYRTRDGEPIEFFDFLHAIKGRRYQDIVMDSPALATSFLVSDASVYNPYLDEASKALMAATLALDDGSMAKRIPITRSYANLMQSPAYNFEAAFAQTLHQHGFAEPFLYAYTLRATEMVGSSGCADLQKRIDDALR